MTDQEPTKQISGASQPRDAPQRNSEPVARDQCAALRLTHIVWRVWMRFTRDGGSLMAAATAFYGLICLIPLVGLTVSVLGRILGSTPSGDAKDQVLAFLHTVVPLEAPSVEDAIRQFPQPSGSWLMVPAPGTGTSRQPPSKLGLARRLSVTTARPSRHRR